MKKLSLLVLICLLLPVVLTACTAAEVHTHAYATEWAFNAESHYHACSCGDKSGTAAHADADNDGACDVCAIVMSNNHAFDKAWTSDETGHWHQALCGHDVIDGKANHKADTLGRCSVCGYQVNAPEMSTIEDALKIAEVTQGDVVTGILTETIGSLEYSESSYTWYEYGENYLHVFNASNEIHYYATLEKDGSVFYLTIMDDPQAPVSVDKDANASYLAGPQINLSNLIGLDEIHYGPISVIDRLYNLEAGRTAPDFAEDVKDGVYSFSYTAAISFFGQEPTNVKVAVEFTFDPNTLIMDDVSITVGEGDMIRSLDYIQTIIPVNNHTPELVTPVSYDIANAKGEVMAFTNGTAAAMNLYVGTHTFGFTNLAPTTALIDILGVSARFVDAEGNDVYDGVYATYSHGTVYFTINKPGSYIAEIAVGSTRYLIPINCTYAIPTQLDLYTYNDWYMEYTPATSYEMIVGESLELVAMVADGCERNNYTATVVGSNAADAILEEGYNYTASGEEKKYYFSTDVAGTYTIEFVSGADANVKATFTVTVTAPAISVQEIARGKYVNGMGTIVVNFYPADAENTSGVAIAAFNSKLGSDTITFNYTIVDNAFTAMPTTDQYPMAELSINSNDGVIYAAMSMLVGDVVDYAGDADPLPGEGGGSGEGGGFDDPAGPIEIQPGGAMSATNFQDKTATYTTTIAANSDGYFALYMNDNIGAQNVTLTFEGDVTVSYRNEATPADFSAYTNGTVVGYDYYTNYNHTFKVTNSTAADVTVTITVTFTAA